MVHFFHQSIGDDDPDADEPVCNGSDGYITEFLASTFLNFLKKGRDEGQSKYTSHGHRAEKPFLLQFWEIMNSTDIGSNFEAIYCPGLVHKKEKLHIRDSADEVVIEDYSNDGDQANAIGFKIGKTPVE